MRSALSLTDRKDAMEADLIRPNHSEFGSSILFVRKAYGSVRLCIDYRGLYEVTRKDAYTLPRVDDTLDELKDDNFYTHLNLAIVFTLNLNLAFGKFECVIMISTRLLSKRLMA
jgi:hypothetical protein